jgi:hypothetical protein
MRFKINIDYPAEKMEASRKRMEARNKAGYHDRVPVNFTLVPRYFANIFGIDYCEIFKDAQTQYYWLLQFAKYQIENIPCDMCTEPVIYVHPYFDNAITSSAFGAEVVWPKNETLQVIPSIKDVDGMENMKIPGPADGLCGRTIDWWLEMKGFAKDTEVTFNGIKGRVEVAPLCMVGLGPHSIAVDLVGTDFYWWMIEYPGECRRFLDKITQGLIFIEDNTRKVCTEKKPGFGLAEDSSQIMSDELFRKFTVPYARILFDRYGTDGPDGRGMHMCGNSVHLQKTLVEELRITNFNGFGYLVPPKTAARNMGGKVLLWGNIDPMLVKSGTEQEVKNACMEAMEALAGFGGFMLGDGANICPLTSLGNLAAFVEASEGFSLAHPELFNKNI